MFKSIFAAVGFTYLGYLVITKAYETGYRHGQEDRS